MKICSVEGCSNPVVGKGFCNTHYIRWRRHGDPLYRKIQKAKGKICSVEGCSKKVHCVGLCQTHYVQQRKRSNPSYGKSQKECLIEGCSKKVFCRGMCSTHYVRWQRHGDPFHRKTQKANTRKCKHPGCNRLNEVGDYCTKHYERFRKYGKTDDSVLKTLKSIHPKKRIWFCSKADAKTGCWIWQKGKDKDGYGQFTFKNKHFRAHRVAYRLFVGKIPKGMFVLHKCDTPSCVNPAHLFLGTNDDNMADMVEKERQQKGIEKENSKLTDDQVREIKKRLLGTETISDIARDYPIDRKVVSRIKAGKTWKHIKI